jgi:ABC-2 type transport system ATP-binding protein
MDKQTVVSIKEVSKSYRDFFGRPKVKAVDALTLNVNKGEVLGLLGPNGSGKTTTMKLLLGLIFPDYGEIRIWDKKIPDKKVYARLGFMPEESYLYRFLNAKETLSYYGGLFSLSRATIKDRTQDLLNKVGLTKAQNKPLKDYSKGMLRRITMAQALINEPDLLLLDEPTAGLDPIGAHEIKQLILNLKKEGKTVILSSHLLSDVEDVCDKIAILYNGQLIKSGNKKELLTLKNILQFSVKNLSEAASSELKKFLSDNKAILLEKKNPNRTLEDLFLEIIGSNKT